MVVPMLRFEPLPNNSMRAAEQMMDYFKYSIRMIPILGISTISYFIAWWRPGHFAIAVKPLSYRMIVRGGTSDPRCLRQIFQSNCYPLLNLGKSPNILDLGANVGYSSAYFAHHYPQANVIAVEPDVSNFSILEKNVKRYPRVVPIHCAIGAKDGFANVVKSDVSAWAYQFAPVKSTPPSTAVRAVSISNLMNQFEVEHWDLVKIDIEGMERDLFSANLSWMDHVSYVIIEVHRSCWHDVFAAFAKYEYDAWLSGENMIFELKPRHR
jgi:FkbM family methyltransferase